MIAHLYSKTKFGQSEMFTCENCPMTSENLL